MSNQEIRKDIEPNLKDPKLIGKYVHFLLPYIKKDKRYGRGNGEVVFMRNFRGQIVAVWVTADSLYPDDEAGKILGGGPEYRSMERATASIALVPEDPNFDFQCRIFWLEDDKNRKVIKAKSTNPQDAESLSAITEFALNSLRNQQEIPSSVPMKYSGDLSEYAMATVAEGDWITFHGLAHPALSGIKKLKVNMTDVVDLMHYSEDGLLPKQIFTASTMLEPIKNRDFTIVNLDGFPGPNRYDRYFFVKDGKVGFRIIRRESHDEAKKAGIPCATHPV